MAKICQSRHFCHSYCWWQERVAKALNFCHFRYVVKNIPQFFCNFIIKLVWIIIELLLCVLLKAWIRKIHVLHHSWHPPRSPTSPRTSCPRIGCIGKRYRFDIQRDIYGESYSFSSSSHLLKIKVSHVVIRQKLIISWLTTKYFGNTWPCDSW
jgi:hypothetical protein